MTGLPPLPAGALYVCNECQMIGSQVEAVAHKITRGHEVVRLDFATEQAVRAQREADEAS